MRNRHSTYLEHLIKCKNFESDLRLFNICQGRVENLQDWFKFGFYI